jgi:hypothetical protein
MKNNENEKWKMKNDNKNWKMKNKIINDVKWIMK